MTSERPHFAATPSWRKWVAPAALAIIVLSAAGAIANAALPAGDDAAHDAVAQVSAPVAPASVPALAAPAPTASPEPYVSAIEIVLPPPPPPAATAPTRGSANQRIEAAASAGVTTPGAWCDGGYGATASASSVSGLLAAANAERARWGLGALTWSGSLASSAQAWSADMAARGGPLDHGMLPSPGGQNVAYRYSSAGQSESAAAAWAHPSWMSSTGHCKNILSANWSTMGAGAASADGGLTWFLTANFQ